MLKICNIPVFCNLCLVSFCWRWVLHSKNVICVHTVPVWCSTHGLLLHINAQRFNQNYHYHQSAQPIPAEVRDQTQRSYLAPSQMAPTSFSKDTKTNCVMSPASSPVDKSSCCAMSSSVSHMDGLSHNLKSNTNSPEEAKPDGVVPNGSSQEDLSSDCLMSTASFPKNTKSDYLSSPAGSEEDTKHDDPLMSCTSTQITKPDSITPLAKCSEVTHFPCLVSRKRCQEGTQSIGLSDSESCSEKTHSACLVSCPAKKQKPSTSLLCHKCPEEKQSVCQLCFKRCQEITHCTSCTSQGKSQTEIEIVKSNELRLLQLEDVEARRKIPISMFPPRSRSLFPLAYKTLGLGKTHHFKDHEGDCSAIAASIARDVSLIITRTL
ncbi:uncharacterized protein LOC123504670 isoform X2 [Portunus trituberculatus]|uniref:uncharacterized protein LOC123504670 isoform X2 n=1 Tax=Portunus trituberculatus TaxID=210409 RepID=UPI001E1CF147|nr:uncharacterized protein LOC123504670 isoform X2 [Portunus trituberculatus]